MNTMIRWIQRFNDSMNSSTWWIQQFDLSKIGKWPLPLRPPIIGKFHFIFWTFSFLTPLPRSYIRNYSIWRQNHPFSICQQTFYSFLQFCPFYFLQFSRHATIFATSFNLWFTHYKFSNYEWIWSEFKQLINCFII